MQNKINRFEDLDMESEIFLDLISANITRLRKERGMSQLQLALAMNFESSSYIGRMETRSNGSKFNLSQIYKISRILNVDINLIISG